MDIQVWNGRILDEQLGILQCRSQKLELCNDFAHCDSDHIAESLAGISTSLRSQRILRRPCLLVGDLNIDLLPESQFDPWAAGANRLQHHLDERRHFYQFIVANWGTLAAPGHMHGLPGGQFNSSLEGSLAIVTRIPFGRQLGRPAHIDHAISFGLKATTRVSWHGYMGDHALIDVSISQATLLPKPFSRPLWRCSDTTTLKNWYAGSEEASCLHGYESEDFGISAFLDFWRTGQENFGCKATSSARNLLREPPGLKDLRRQPTSCTDEARRGPLQRMIRLNQAHWLTTLRLLRDRK